MDELDLSHTVVINHRVIRCLRLRYLLPHWFIFFNLNQVCFIPSNSTLSKKKNHETNKLVICRIHVIDHIPKGTETYTLQENHVYLQIIYGEKENQKKQRQNEL